MAETLAVAEILAVAQTSAVAELRSPPHIRWHRRLRVNPLHPFLLRCQSVGHSSHHLRRCRLCHCRLRQCLCCRRRAHSCRRRPLNHRRSHHHHRCRRTCRRRQRRPRRGQSQQMVVVATRRASTTRNSTSSTLSFRLTVSRAATRAHVSAAWACPELRCSQRPSRQSTSRLRCARVESWAACRSRVGDGQHSRA